MGAALRTALRQKTADGRTKARAVADTVVETALAGDMAAVRLIFDRVDGKVGNEMKHSGHLEIRYVNDWRQQGGPVAPDE